MRPASGSEPASPCLHRCGYSITGAQCPDPPRHDQSTVVCFQQWPRKSLGSHQGQGRESLHGPQPSTQQVMQPSWHSPTLNISGTKSADWVHTGVHPAAHPCVTLGGSAQLFTSGCCPVASQLLETSARTSPLPGKPSLQLPTDSPWQEGWLGSAFKAGSTVLLAWRTSTLTGLS